MRFKLALALILIAAGAASLALAVPVRPAAKHVEYRLAFRHKKMDEAAPQINFRTEPTRDGVVLHKVGGPETVEALLGKELHGDFSADIEVDIAGFGALGIRPNGGTPVPYWGFRSSSGEKETYFLLSTFGGKWHPQFLQIRRTGDKITAKSSFHDCGGFNQPCSEPGFICFVMNDTSKIRIRSFTSHGTRK
jgi:hypothetical protein